MKARISPDEVLGHVRQTAGNGRTEHELDRRRPEFGDGPTSKRGTRTGRLGERSNSEPCTHNLTVNVHWQTGIISCTREI